ncbi:lipid IV(A) 3-deoxy-D-manno-octulosonic acid transferase [Alteromonas lipolytica]|uniref:3-deoxy-D-manno-octulosonic acid transferase n=1 Tax=Alteromonas lipolytica TaxID=1856405 RepID=A0A1E8FB97_9ALTE|nr:lipid IV(A) 3-deoxy-D-manno-octulosonic acid transferase [Alteromonas lipolytica]OFI33191.1 3-deoxy-D-manno-octulosonic acid transferase [Alteromonas lipolytica]GGF61750.1 3-deoxy-D-manno-octulosonic acid transferase [Alteromonas lipolytica]
MSKKDTTYSPKWYQDAFRWFYSCVLALIIPFAFLNLVKRGLTRQQDYNRRRFERFGYVAHAPKADGYLFHCVSVGEVVAASVLIKRIMQEQPDRQIIVTTTTPTGSARVRAIFGDKVHHFYLPYDLHMAMAGMLKRIRPSAVFITEVELWPNMIHACWKRDIPILVINARMTDRSARRYAKFPVLFEPMLHKLSHVCAQGERDYANYRFLGLPETKLTLTNNIKFDQASAIESGESGFLGLENSARKILVGGSTHEPEEQVLLNSYQSLKADFPELMLILVPRHPERFDTVAKLIGKTGLSMVKTTDITEIPSDCDVVLVNEMGKLNAVYTVADFAFVGGSIADRGGHNALEPAANKLPVIMGPNTYNNPVICAKLAESGALFIKQDSQAIAELLHSWCSAPEIAERAGYSGYEVLVKNSGALDKTLQVIRQCVG